MNGQDLGAEKKLVSKGKASLGLGDMPAYTYCCVYLRRALITARNLEMSSDDFKGDLLLAPLDSVLRESNICRLPLARCYCYPRGDAVHMEQAIQSYFNGKIADPLNDLFTTLV